MTTQACPAQRPLPLHLSHSLCFTCCCQVEYYGALTPLKQLASIAVPDASTLSISPFDKGSLKEIEKAINSSDIGINPNNDGQNIRLNIPAMTQVHKHSQG
jgi:ribosome recycling factor